MAVVIIAVVLGAGFWIRHETFGAALSSRPVGTMTPSRTTTASGTSASTSSSSTTTVPFSAATLAAYQASARADAAAAVPFPGAPALPPDLPSVGGLRLHPKHKYIALTFDDGYNFQLPMLEPLQRYHVRATTFLIGEWIQDNESIVRRLNVDGFEIANHTWSHVNLTKLSAAQVAAELSRNQRLITSITGNQAPYLRPPGGATDPEVKATASRLGYRIVLWDRTFGESHAYYHVMQERGGVQPGDVILCHWADRDAYAAMQRILPELKAQGYQFVTISELIADSTGR